MRVARPHGSEQVIVGGERAEPMVMQHELGAHRHAGVEARREF
jgi:phage gp45-like